MIPRLLSLSAAAASALALGACGGEDRADSSQEPAGASKQRPAAAASAHGGHAVAVKTFIYRPSRLAVKRGATVKWTNSDEAAHTATSGARANPDAPGKKDGRFDGALKASGGTFSHTFTKAGTYRYFCALHTGSGMTGVVVVS